jgi:hypothetical protein
MDREELAKLVFRKLEEEGYDDFNYGDWEKTEEEHKQVYREIVEIVLTGKYIPQS